SGGPTKIEEILSDADVASAAPFPRGDVREGMLHRHSFSEDGAPRTSLLKSSELLLVSLVVSDRDGAAPSRCRLCALGAERAGSTCLWVELNGLARFEGFNFASGARNRLGAEVELEVEFAEKPRSPWALSPWFRDYLPTALAHFVDNRAIDVSAVN